MDALLRVLLTPTGLAVAGIVLVLIILIATYNRYVSLRNRVEEAFRAIDTYLEQRFDQLTKLADAIASYNQHEKGVHTELAKIRTGYRAMTRDEKVAAANIADGCEAQCL